MIMEVNGLYEGFRLEERVELKEINSIGYIYTHDKTKGKLIKIENDDDNKVFSIGFRTPPKNSTGVAHILEHSVLCGSRKFNTKEPFVELLKGSLNTFLNAMTFPDKTIYPVASRNNKDFLNLMDVYLDAVLYPNIYKYPEIFMQEGWHYELEGEELKYNGVVYNEMKGAYSSPDSIFMRKIPNTLFPETTYKESSGGDPKHIPELTYEEFLDFHKKYYHPSNSFVMLYGNGDTLEELKFINDNYFKDFEEKKIDSEIKTQDPLGKMVEKQYFYGVSKEDSLDNKTYLSLNYVIKDSTDYETYLAFQVLEHLLLKTQAAPIKKALIENGIGNSVSGDYNNGIKQPVFSIVVKGANDGDKNKFNDIVYKTLNDLVQKGIDKSLIEASINKLEFELREGDFEGYPSGLIHYMRIMDSWLYGGEPFVHLQYDKAFKKIREALDTNYFESLIKKYMLDSNHSSLVMLSPIKGENERLQKETEDELKAKKEKMSSAQLEEIKLNFKKLKERQNSEDSEEALKSIPLIDIKDINKKTDKIPREERKIDGTNILFHKLPTNRISYTNLYFNTSGVKKEDIQYIRLLSDILGKIDTKKYDYATLSNLVNINIGGLSYSPVAFNNLKEKKEFTPYFAVSIKNLTSNFDKSFDILEEILNNSKFDDSNRLLTLIKEIKSKSESGIIENGHQTSLRKVLSYLSNKGYYEDKMMGISYYKFLCELEKNFEKEKLISTLEKTKNVIFNKNNLTVGFTGEEEDYKKLSQIIPSFIKTLSDDKIQKEEYNFELEKKNEGLLTQGNVQYVAKGGDYSKDGYTYNGALKVLETISGFDYLWNNVRVKGGAYGVFITFRRDGGACIVSYRDPNIKETLSIYDGMSEYLKSFNASDREMNKYVIGTIRKLDQPLTNATKGDVSDAYYFTGITDSDLQKEREEVLNTNVNTIREFKDLLDKLMKQKYICVLGNENKLKDNKDLFNDLVKVIE